MSPPTHSPVQLTLNFRSSISTKSSQFGSICLNHESILFYIIYIAILFAAQPPPRQLEGLKYLTRPGIPSQHAAWSSELLATSMFRCSAFPLFPCKTEPNKKVSIQVDYLTGRVSNQQGMAAHGILLWHFDQQAAQVWSNGHVTGTSGRPGMHCSGRRPRARSRIWRALNAWRLEMPGLGTSRSLNWRHSEARGHSNAYYDLIMAYSIIIQRSTARRKWICLPPWAQWNRWLQRAIGLRDPQGAAVAALAALAHGAAVVGANLRNRPSHLDTSCFHRTSTSLSKIHEVSASESAMFGSKSCFFALVENVLGPKTESFCVVWVQ